MRAFGHLTGRVFGFRGDEEYMCSAEYRGEQVNLIYQDTGESRVINNKPRRIFELVRIDSDG